MAAFAFYTLGVAATLDGAGGVGGGGEDIGAFLILLVGTSVYGLVAFVAFLRDPDAARIVGLGTAVILVVAGWASFGPLLSYFRP